jgi:putative ATP-dependent endonuclease of OLD family
MKPKRVHILNFRHISNVEIQIEDILALIGPNNVGKSSILRAIQYFCEPVTQIPDVDFNESNSYLDIEVTIEFTDLSAETKKRYHSRLLAGDRLVVKKVWSKGEKKPDFFSKEMKPTAEKLANIERNWKLFKDDPTWKTRAEEADKKFQLKDQITDFVEEYLQNHMDEFTWEEGWVPNPSGLQEILTHHMPEVIFIEGVIDVPQEVSTKSGSTISKILNMLVKEALGKDEDAKEIST